MKYIASIVRISLAFFIWIMLAVSMAITSIILVGMAENRFDVVRLPNGSYMSHRHFFAFTREDIVLRRADGEILVNESIYWVCFNERFVEGMTFDGPKPDFSRYTSRRFIYEKGHEEAIFNVDPRYYEALDRSGLMGGDRCGSHGGVRDFYVLLQDPKYRR